MTTRTLRIALAGNPNSGKTSLFNALTGGRQRVGNYPGVTVERREGRYIEGDRVVEVLDLPGTYSLASYSPEERVAQDALLERRADAVVAVVDANAVERGLVLVTQLALLGGPGVLCLNMSDEAHRAGQRLDLALLEARLGMPVVETVGHRAIGVDALRAAIERADTDERAETSDAPTRPSLGQPLDGALERLAAAVERCPELPARCSYWLATRLLVDDAELAQRLAAAGPAGAAALTLAAEERASIEACGVDAQLLLMQRYQAHVQRVLEDVVQTPARSDARRVSDAVDAILVNRVIGLPIFLALMYGVFWLVFKVGEIPMQWIEQGCAALAASVGGLWAVGADSALRSLLVDGVISGVGGVLVFLPNIVLLFFCLSLLENSGYMARAAFLMDRLLHRFGLHGRSFLPLMTGFGCSIPGIMATRTLENEKDRLATMLVLPLMSCGARLAVWMLLVPAFFAKSWRAPVLFGIYVAGILLALGLSLLLRRSLLRGDDSPFVMELPPYRLPAPRNVLLQLGERAGIYLRKAGTVLLAFAIVLWALSSYPKPASYAVDARIAAGATVAKAEAQRLRRTEALQHSVAGRLGRALAPVMAPLGFDWRVSTAVLGAFAAKEVFVAQLAIVYSLDHQSKQGTARLGQALAREMTPLAGISLILFLLIATPCMATVAILRRETGSWRWPALQFFGLTAIGYLVSLIVFQLGRALGLGG